MSSIVVYGSATHRNTGDLAMMHGLFRWLRESLPEHPALLLTRNPGESQLEFGLPCRCSHDEWLLAPAHGRPPTKVRVILRGIGMILGLTAWRMSPRRVEAWLPLVLTDVFRLLRDAQALVIHGSGSTNSIFWRGWLYPKAITVFAAWMMGKPVVITSQGLGPFQGVMDRLMARLLFCCSTFIGVRDDECSAGQARSLGAVPSRIHHTGDDAWLVPEAPDAAIADAMKAENLPGNVPLIGVNVRDATSYSRDFAPTAKDKLARILDRLIETTGAHLVFIPVTYDPDDDDRASAAEVVARMQHAAAATIVRGEYRAEIIRGMIGRMHQCVGISYHFLLFALGQGVPALALTENRYYLTKHEGLMSLFGCPENRVDLPGASGEELSAMSIRLLQQRDEISAMLKERIRGEKRRTALTRIRMAEILRSG